MKSGRQSDTSSPTTSGGSSGGGGGGRAKRRANSAAKAPTNKSKKMSATAKALSSSGGHLQPGTVSATPPSSQPQHQQPEYAAGAGSSANGGASGSAPASAHNLSPISSREKHPVHSSGQHRTGNSYAGFHAKSIRTIWDQHELDVHSEVMTRLADETTSNRSRKPAHERREHDLDVHPEVLARLAEDATYKMWELVNNLKTYARHSGGPVTCDLLNELLRHSDADAILGAAPSCHHWNSLEQQTSHTGTTGSPLPATVEQTTTYYFPPDRLLDLRDEYLRDVQTAQSAPVQLSCLGAADAAADVDLRRLAAALCAGLLSDRPAARAYAVHTVAINPMVGVAAVFGALLQLCVRALAFEYAASTLRRVVELLGALMRNATVCETTVNTHNAQWWHVVQVLLCAVLGPADLNGTNSNLASAPATDPTANWDGCVPEKMEVMDTMAMDFPPVDAGRLADDMDTIFMTDESGVNMTALTVDAELMTIIKQEVDKQVKMETVAAADDRYQAPTMLMDGGHDGHMLAAGVSDGGDEDENGEEEHSRVPQPETFSALQTHRCADEQLDELVRVIGELAAHWGYVETELIYVVSKRMRAYFAESVANVVDRMIDFDWLGRLVRLLWSLGDFAFRELTVHLSLIDTDRVPAAVRVHFNACAIYLRGRSDIFLYEYLYEMCGDAIMPFLCYFAQFNQKFATRRRRRWAVERRQALCIPVKCRIRQTNRLAAAAATAAASTTNGVWERESDLVPTRAKPMIKITLSGDIPSAVSVVNGTAAATATAATDAKAPTFTSAVRLNRFATIYRGRLIGSYSQPKYRQFSVVDYHHMAL